MDGPGSTTPLLRIGILGAAKIAHKNIFAIKTPGSDCVLTALASRSLEKAQLLLKDCSVNDDSSSIKIFSGPTAYDELVKSDICDALYIPLPTMLHKEWVIKALQSNKHVLLEKPVAPKAADYQEMLQMAYRQGKYLQDGTMFVHHPRTQQILDRVATHQLGNSASGNDRDTAVTRIEAALGFCADEQFLQANIRTAPTGDPLGCVGDCGWYCVRLALLVFGAVHAVPVSAQIVDWQLNAHGVPLDATGIVKFAKSTTTMGSAGSDQQHSSSSMTLCFHCGFRNTPLRTYAEIYGTHKWLRVNDFVLPGKAPNSYSIQSLDIDQWHLETTPHVDTIAVTTDGDKAPSLAQEVLMWKTFAQLSATVAPSDNGGGWKSKKSSDGGGNDEEANKLAKHSLDTQRVCDALMESIRKDGAKIRLAL